MVLVGDAVPVPVFDEDTTIVTLETQGSTVSYASCRSFVDSESSYNVLLSVLIVWMCSKNRYFWTGDPLGSQIKEMAQTYYDEHKKVD